MSRRILFAALGVLALGLLAGCAAGPNPVAGVGDTAGFWQGIWHGFISPIALVVSFFNNQVGIYEVHNNGGWYNVGFVLGASAFFGGGGGAGARSMRR